MNRHPTCAADAPGAGGFWVDEWMSSTSSRSSAGGLIAPMATTPGRAPMRSAMRSRYGTPVPSVRWVEVVCSRSVRTPAGTNPGSTCCSCQSDRSIKVAAMPSMSASATCAATSPPSARWRPGVSVPVCCRSSGCNPGRIARRAGTSAMTAARPTDAVRIVTNTTPSSAISVWRGTSGGIRATSSGNALHASASPASEPMVASTACSTSSCRTSSPLDAPTAVRTASSRARAIEPPSTSVPRFTPPSSRMKPTAPSRSRSVGRTFPVIDSCKALARRVWPQSSGFPISRRISQPAPRAPRKRPRPRRRLRSRRVPASTLLAGAAASPGRVRARDPEIGPPAQHLDAVGITPTTFVGVPDRPSTDCGRARPAPAPKRGRHTCRRSPRRARGPGFSRRAPANSGRRRSPAPEHGEEIVGDAGACDLERQSPSSVTSAISHPGADRLPVEAAAPGRGRTPSSSFDNRFCPARRPPAVGTGRTAAAAAGRHAPPRTPRRSHRCRARAAQSRSAQTPAVAPGCGCRSGGHERACDVTPPGAPSPAARATRARRQA